MELCVFSSGSKGNCTYIASASTALLVDFGISFCELKNDLEKTGKQLDELSAVLVTHSHTDHCSGLNVLEKKCGLPIFATEETASAVDLNFVKELKHSDFSLDWRCITPGNSFEIGDLSITSFEVPHDANGAVAYTISDGKVKIGIATDLGFVTNSVSYHLRDCDALILEMNHDSGMLRDSDRKEYLKNRISSRLGHLSNEQAIEFLESPEVNRLKYLFPAHVSHDCNDKSLIDSLLFNLARRKQFKVVETFQSAPSEVILM